MLVMLGIPVMANDGISDIEEALSGLGKTVRTDRYWLYLYETGRFAIPEIESWQVRSEFTDPIELDEKIYYTFHTEQIDNKPGEDKLIFPDYFLREENGVVYLNIRQGFLYGIGYEDKFESHNEVPLYDFNLMLGSKFESVLMPELFNCVLENSWLLPYAEPYSYLVADINYRQIGNEDIVAYTLTEYSDFPDINNEDYWEKRHVEYIEGIGMVKPKQSTIYPYFIFLPFNNCSGPLPNSSFCYEAHCGLIGVYDKNDNLIYKGDADPIPDGVSNISAPDNSSVTYYNMQGLKVVKPEPGQLYIERSGSQTRKVIMQ